jgi:hypothetical protein
MDCGHVIFYEELEIFKGKKGRKLFFKEFIAKF